MTLSKRFAVTLAAFVTTLPLAACGGEEDGDESAGTGGVGPEAANTLGASTGGAGGEMRLTLTDDDCTYEGDETPAAGMFTIEVENQTEYFGAFAIAGIAEGSTIDDLQPFLEEASQQFQENGTLPDPPAFYSQMVRSGVEAGASGSLPVDVPAGTYALMCFIDDLPTWEVHAAAQLDVSE